MTGSRPVARASQRRSFAGSGLAVLAAIGLAGCSNFGAKQNSYTCPPAITVAELQTLVQVVPGPNGATVQSSGRISTVAATCEREGDNGIVSSVTIEFAGLRTTPAVTRLDLPYFVAMADSTGNILGKQQFTISLGFESNAPVTKASDSVTVHMPLKNAQLGNVYTLVAGFQLNSSQLAYNRAHLQ
jgi:hypothetical protein